MASGVVGCSRCAPVWNADPCPIPFKLMAFPPGASHLAGCAQIFEVEVEGEAAQGAGVGSAGIGADRGVDQAARGRARRADRGVGRHDLGECILPGNGTYRCLCTLPIVRTRLLFFRARWLLVLLAGTLSDQRVYLAHRTLPEHPFHHVVVVAFYDVLRQLPLPLFWSLSHGSTHPHGQVQLRR